MSRHTLKSLLARCDEIGQCWIWRGAVDGKDRPVIIRDGKRVGARLVARELKDRRAVASHLVMTTTCGCKRCISPACSVAVPEATSKRMAAERGVYRSAAKSAKVAMTKRARSRFTAGDIELVKAARSGAAASLAVGMSESYAKAIRAGTARRDYSSPFAGLIAANDSRRRAA